MEKANQFRGVSIEIEAALQEMNALGAKDVPIEAIQRLLAPEGRPTLRRLLHRVHQDWLDAQPMQAAVVYVGQGYSEIRKSIRCFIRDEYRDDKIEFEPIERLQKMYNARMLGVFYIPLQLVEVEEGATLKEVYSEIERRGLRPALYEEHIGFVTDYLEMMRYRKNMTVIALGSKARKSDGNYFASLWTGNSDDSAALGTVKIGSSWTSHCSYYFLATAKK